VNHIKPKNMNTQILEPTSNTTLLPPRSHSPAPEPSDYVNVSPQASAYGIPLAVLLDQRILTEYRELEPSLGDDTTGVILSVLAFHLLTRTIGNSGRLPVYLLRREDQQLVELDLRLTGQKRDSGQRLYLRLAGVRELGSPAVN
jgi:hypothetical protein